MAENTRFYVCPICGNVIGLIDGDANHIMCCGKAMVPLVANSVDAAHEKHVPVYTVEGNTITVKIGSVPHPMTEAHLISWVAGETKKGNMRRTLKAGQEPVVTFPIESDDEVVAVYAYCNLHGLWKA